MTRADSWTGDPFVIHVNGDPTADLVAAARAGALVKTLELGGLRTVDDLYRRTTTVFEIPYPMGGWPGMVDWLAGPDWLPLEEGALLIFDASDAEPTLIAHVASMLPSVTERWRTGGRPFVTYLVHVSDLNAVEPVISEANARLDDFARDPVSVNASGSVSVRYE